MDFSLPLHSSPRFVPPNFLHVLAARFAPPIHSVSQGCGYSVQARRPPHVSTQGMVDCHVLVRYSASGRTIGWVSTPSRKLEAFPSPQAVAGGRSAEGMLAHFTNFEHCCCWKDVSPYAVSSRSIYAGPLYKLLPGCPPTYTQAAHFIERTSQRVVKLRTGLVAVEFVCGADFIARCPKELRSFSSDFSSTCPSSPLKSTNSRVSGW
ncbi:hypothetical protein JAAARDRAFT_424221 [Jaapia argillacea MUCL 33604]|uniref:Uncharacterized protein n=1 Tax=Jaapia argillacea MUCL 33604 TaxID=933084 RepID=A0A067PR76_9AGAM|nr:hypothetical protein JAAARDRAFT_424221 [Jaapia argillacea MUCL 33604]